MKKIAFFGATSGLGKQVVPLLGKYTVDRIGSTRVNFENENDIGNYFYLNSDLDVLVVFTNYNYNSLVHKYRNKSAELNKQLHINIQGVTECISYALDCMRKNNYGRIIIASSIVVDRSIVGAGIYGATKAYYENLVKTVAIENAAKNITANCIQLGYMDGGLTYTLDPVFLESTIQSIPAKKLGTPQEIANTISFLIDTEYVNGATIKLTGGL
jgi:NAD(P)-dependent dehydrogenase (short-subunit alcohol dehydrogenase family)